MAQMCIDEKYMFSTPLYVEIEVVHHHIMFDILDSKVNI